MAPYRVGIIGCGRPRREAGATGYGMSHAHARGYETSPDAQIVALADNNPDNARAFQAEHGGEHVYADYQEMLARERLDIVSVCTWPHLHAPMVIAAAEAGVRAIHCEKPMAPTWGEARRMAAVCAERGVQLTFDHQRRFGEPFRKARALLQQGAIGSLTRMEATCANLFDWGTHWFDMLQFLNDETPAEWVLGQVESRGGRRIFGVFVESQGVSLVCYRNGVYGLLVTGELEGWGPAIRLLGDAGSIEIGAERDVPLRLWERGQIAWTAVPVSEGLHGEDCVMRGVLDLIDALKTGREPELAARKALQATELIFATYESARIRGRVDLPLPIEDSPLLTMLAEGLLQE